MKEVRRHEAGVTCLGGMQGAFGSTVGSSGRLLITWSLVRSQPGQPFQQGVNTRTTLDYSVNTSETFITESGRPLGELLHEFTNLPLLSFSDRVPTGPLYPVGDRSESCCTNSRTCLCCHSRIASQRGLYTPWQLFRLSKGCQKICFCLHISSHLCILLLVLKY